MDFTQHDLDDLALLIVGCLDHPGYRARRAPRGPCARCAQMYQVKDLLDQLAIRYYASLLREARCGGR